jgi:hypothetical protein
MDGFYFEFPKAQLGGANPFPPIVLNLYGNTPLTGSSAVLPYSVIGFDPANDLFAISGCSSQCAYSGFETLTPAQYGALSPSGTEDGFNAQGITVGPYEP